MKKKLIFGLASENKIKTLERKVNNMLIKMFGHITAYQMYEENI